MPSLSNMKLEVIDKVSDAKLKELVQLCMETQNYKKIAVVGFTSLSNQIDEIAIKLGVRQRNKDRGEKLFEYMMLINDIFQENFKIPIFKNEIIQKLHEIELIFLKAQGNIPLESIRQILRIYYELRAKSIPNLHETLTEEDIPLPHSLKLISLFSPGDRKKNHNSLNSLLLYKVQGLGHELRRDFDYDFNSDTLEKTILLKSIEKNLERNRKKIAFQGSLKDNITYQKSQSSILGYFILGICIVLGIVGTISLTQMFIYPEISGISSSFVLFCLGPCLILILVYYHYFKKGDSY